MITDSSSSTGYGTIVMFCSDAEGLIRRVHSVRQMFVSKSYGDQMKEDVSSSLSTQTSCSSDNLSGDERSPDDRENAGCRKSLADPWLERIGKAGAACDRGSAHASSKTGAVRRKLWNNMANIPEIMLDSSINFQTGCKTIYEETAEKGRQSLRESTSIEEGDEYRSLHEKIASADDSFSVSPSQ